MQNEIIYMDNNATTPMEPEVINLMQELMKSTFANPSGIYRVARQAREIIEDARKRVSKVINGDGGKIIFTGGGSEADNLAIKGIAMAKKLSGKGNHIITSSVEHKAVINACQYLEKQGFEITYLPVDSSGLIDLDALEKSIKENTILISIIFANNETGVIQPISEIAKIASKYGVCFHTDAVQVPGKLKIDVEELGIDMLTLSSHKFYGPKGVGMLYVRNWVKLHPLLHGGGHEYGLRAGTENVPGIAGFARALEIVSENIEEKTIQMKLLRDRLETGLQKIIPHTTINGHKERRLCNTTNITFKNIEGEAILLYLDAAGICASTGSACSSRDLKPSHVLTAMGVAAEEAHGSIRFSVGKFTTEKDVERVLEIVPETVEKLRALSPLGSE